MDQQATERAHLRAAAALPETWFLDECLILRLLGRGRACCLDPDLCWIVLVASVDKTEVASRLTRLDHPASAVRRLALLEAVDECVAAVASVDMVLSVFDRTCSPMLLIEGAVDVVARGRRSDQIRLVGNWEAGS